MARVTVLLAITTADGAPLVRWAARFAQARGADLELLFVNRGVKPQSPEDILDDQAAAENPVVKALLPVIHEVLDGELAGEFVRHDGTERTADSEGQPPRLRLRRVLHPNAARAVMNEIDALDAELLVVGKHSPNSDRWAGRLARKLLSAASCEVVVMRAKGDSGKTCERILAPTLGGLHARQGLRLGAAMTLKGSHLRPLHVIEEEMGDDADALGMRQLTQWLQQADIAPNERIVPEVVIADSAEAGIAPLADDTDLLLVGATDRGVVRRTLFGDLADQLLQGERAGAVAVMRRRRPLHRRTLDVARRLSQEWVPQLDRDERLDLFEHLQQGSHFNTDFLALISLSTAIASLGLLQGSTAVVIGAMLVAPLMTPMIGAGLALVQGNALLMRNAAQAITLGFLTALGIGALFGLLVPGTWLTPELLQRGSPTLLDLVVALLSGVAAAYALARPGLTGALPGVAIAAALVPPISTAGVALARGEVLVGQRAALLFATNLVAIVLGAALVFRAMGVHGKKDTADAVLWVRRVLMGLVLVSVILTVPLGFYLYNKVVQHERDRILVTPALVTRVSDRVQTIESLRLVSLQRHTHDDHDELEVVVASAKQPAPDLAQRVAEAVEEELAGPIDIRVTCLRSAWSVAPHGP